jgi:phenylalanyl-tRNA synthetase beta chain
MKVSRSWLKTFFEKDIPTSVELADLFTFHSFEVESVEKKGGHDVLDVKVLPDRAHYCLSHQGVAEEIHIVTGQPMKTFRDLPTLAKAAVSNPSVLPPKVKIEEPKKEDSKENPFCRHYMVRRIEKVTVADSPDWLKNYLQDIGERPINNIVDATNLIMFDIGQPLHAFDADAIKGDISVRAAQKGEKIILLDGKEATLILGDYVIADDAGPLAIAGVKGGKRAQVTATTKNIIIESANFDPAAVRRTATRLNIRNESSKRFENEITPELAADGMTLVSALVRGLVPGSADGMSDIIDIYPMKPSQTVITLTRAYVNDRLGADVPEKTFNEILSRLGVTVADTGGKLALTIPYHRLDLTIPEDIVEEIGRVYGYEKIKAALPPAPTKPISVLPSFYLSEKIKNILAGQSFSEVNLYTLVSKGLVETAHPLASDKAFARENLTDGLMTCLEKNVLNADLLGLDVIKIFEVGRVFTKGGEFSVLSMGVAQVKKIKNVKSEAILKSTIEVLGKELGSAISVPSIISNGIHSVCQINLDELTTSYKLSVGASYADLGFGPSVKISYKRFSAYPFIVRDIAVFTPEHIEAEEVWAAIRQGVEDADGSRLLARHALFDTFKKDAKISHAFRMIFQSMEKTLTDEEVGAIMEKIYVQVKLKKWEVR